MKELTEWFRVWIRVLVFQTGPRSLDIINPTHNPLPEFCLLFPPKTRSVFNGAAELRRVSSDLPLYATDLSSNSTLSLEWQNG